MKPRKGDVQAVAELLEKGADTPEDLASEVIQALAFRWYLRDSFVAVTRVSSGHQWAYGPYGTEHQANKAIERGVGRSVDGQQVMTLKVYSPARIEGLIEEAGVGKQFGCSSCKHPEEAHDWPKRATLGCVVCVKPGCTHRSQGLASARGPNEKTCEFCGCKGA